jgi:hypothetical protein
MRSTELSFESPSVFGELDTHRTTKRWDFYPSITEIYNRNPRPWQEANSFDQLGWREKAAFRVPSESVGQNSQLSR